MKKKISLFLFMCTILTFTGIVHAQNITRTVNIVKQRTVLTNSFRASYSPVFVENTATGYGSNVNAFSFEYVKMTSLTGYAPIYLEAGGGFSYAKGKMDAGDLKVELFSINVPLNIGYRFNPSDNNFVFPYVGLNIRGNIAGEYLIDGYGHNVFKRNNILGVGKVLDHLQVGYAFGVNFSLDGFRLGVGYVKDFSNICHDTRISYGKITMGVNF